MLIRSTGFMLNKLCPVQYVSHFKMAGVDGGGIEQKKSECVGEGSCCLKSGMAGSLLKYCSL